MRKGLEVKSIAFGELRGITSKEYRDSTGSSATWDGLMDGAGVDMVLANSSEEIRKAYIYTVSAADIPDGSQWSWGIDVEVEPGEEEVSYVAPMPGISSSDYRDYTGPLRYAVEVTVSESGQPETLFEKVRYYDIPARVGADELEDRKFDIYKALEELERTTLMHDLHIEGDPAGGLKSIKAKLLNFGDKTQYIGIDTRAEIKRRGSGCQTQFFYEVGSKEEIAVDIGSFISTTKIATGMEYLRIRAASIPEQIFKSRRARSRFLGDREALIAKFDFYFDGSE